MRRVGGLFGLGERQSTPPSSQTLDTIHETPDSEVALPSVRGLPGHLTHARCDAFATTLPMHSTPLSPRMESVPQTSQLSPTFGEANADGDRNVSCGQGPPTIHIGPVISCPPQASQDLHWFPQEGILSVADVDRDTACNSVVDIPRMSHILIPNADFAEPCVGDDSTSSLTAHYVSIDHRSLTDHSLGIDTQLAQSLYSDIYGDRNRYDSAGRKSQNPVQFTQPSSHSAALTQTLPTNNTTSVAYCPAQAYAQTTAPLAPPPPPPSSSSSSLSVL